ncbi:MAG: hypothetical protein JW850_21825 [Thermoflexales bacterium]|nr:hypothetical protein [Thermoflexales bacterium]
MALWKSRVRCPERWTTSLAIVIAGLLLTGDAAVANPAAGQAGASFNVSWSTGCQEAPAEAVSALDYAAGLWGTWISSTTPIEVTACWTPNLGSGDALGTGMPSEYVRNFPGAPLVNTYYPIALANALSGGDLNPARADMALQFKSDVTWSFVLTPAHTTAAAADADFVAVALHELAHGLGFVGNMYVSYDTGFCGDGPQGALYPCPTAYDCFVVDSSGAAVLSYLGDDRFTLAARLKSDAHFGGPNTVAANGGTAARLYAPGYWTISSLSHLDQASYEGSPNSLMTPFYSGAARHPGPVTLATFQDMGWLRAGGVPNVTTTGPRVVGVGSAATFSGELLWPGYTGQPLTYTWTTTGQEPLAHPGLTATDQVTLSWDTPGEKAITLTATDGDAFASAVRTALAFAANASGPAQGDTKHAYTFNAGVTLPGFPVTYTWEATDQPIAVHPDRSASDSATFTWLTPGTKTITVTAVIEGAPAQAVHTIDIEGSVFDQFIFLPLVQRQ